jgi:excisionase family DNA binding protein
VEDKPFYMDQAKLQHGMTSAVVLLRLTFERMLEEQKQTLRRLPQPSGSFMTPEQCAEFLGIKINTLYVMKSQGRIPYRKVGHLLRFDFDEIVEWTKDKEK